MRVIIPRILRPDVMSRIPASHQGVEACLRKARDSVFWPNMNAEVRDQISQQCSIWNEFQAKNPKEPMQSHQIPERPWSRVAADQFKLHGKDYIVLVDFYSDLIEVKEFKRRPQVLWANFSKSSSADMALAGLTTWPRKLKKKKKKLRWVHNQVMVLLLLGWKLGHNHDDKTNIVVIIVLCL